jgi:aspartate kinase
MPPPAVVLSFDGEALSSPDHIRAAARRIASAHDQPARLVAVLPAMGGVDAGLVALAEQVSRDPLQRELDMLLATGGRITCALCAMALLDHGVRAVSLSGSQAGVVTDGAHGAADVVEVRPDRIVSELETGAIVLVAALQGVSALGEVTRLDPERPHREALAIARALGAVRCDVIAGDPESAPIGLLPAGTGPVPLERIA